MNTLIRLTIMTALLPLGAQAQRREAPSKRESVDSLRFPLELPTPTALTPKRAFARLTFDRPIFLISDQPGRILVAEQDGRIFSFANHDDVAERAMFLDLSATVHGPARGGGNEEGLLGLALDPDYAANGFFYVHYSVANPRQSVIARFTARNGRADPATKTVLLTVPQPYSNHNGGMLAFGPDSMLYIGLGDGGSANDPQQNAQNKKSLLGKILRIDPRGSGPAAYRVPPDNPFVGDAAARPEIWAYGIRNPWRFSFAADGTLWLADVGQNKFEEINLVGKGDNLGWDVFEGTESFENPDRLPAERFRAPLHVYPHDAAEGGYSVTGGYVYRGRRLSELRGAYVYGDYVTGHIWALVYDGKSVVSNKRVANVAGLSSFGEDDGGELYAVSLNDGFVYRFESTEQRPQARIPQKLSETGIFADVKTLQPSKGVLEYAVRVPFWSDGAEKRRWIAVPGREPVAFSGSGAWRFPLGTVLVKHFELDAAAGRRRLETRVMLHHRQGWSGYVYKWNESQDDAVLQDRAVQETIDLAGGGRMTWLYPSSADCLSCHTAADRVLGVKTAQIHVDDLYSNSSENQLQAFSRIGLFDRDIGEVRDYARYPKIEDVQVQLQDRAKAYLAVNCAQCHAPQAPAPGGLDLRYETRLEDMRLVGVDTTEGSLGHERLKRVQPGSRRDSALWLRMERIDEHRMPKISSRVPDPSGLELIGAWIDGLLP